MQRLRYQHFSEADQDRIWTLLGSGKAIVDVAAELGVHRNRVHLVVDASLEDLRSKKVLWQEKGIESNFISDYTVSFDATSKTDIRATRVATDAAIKQASQDIAWTLRSRVLEGF